MNIEKNNGYIELSPVRDLDLKETLLCGQCFRWFENDDGSFTGIIYGKELTVWQKDDRLIIKGISEKDAFLVEDYFDLPLDYGRIREKLSEMHPVLKEAASYCPGIRILKQEPFEALISFVISQNNNISRIQGIVKRLCENFGKSIGENSYAFPDAKTLSSLDEDDLAVIRAGFRNKYIIDAARCVESGKIRLEELRDIGYDSAKDILMQIKGVGPKVADCTLLYGLHRLDSFPMDVWMKRAMKVLFDDMDPSVFGEYGGIAQQYIFHYSRMHKELFD